MTQHQPIYDRLVERDRDHACPGAAEGTCVSIAATAELPTRFGDFHVVAFWNPTEDKEHAAFVHGAAVDGEDVPVRLHSECLTGDAIGSLRCDCRDQLEGSLRALGQLDHGILLYLRQEGRGIGLTNKIRAYELQDHGLDTVEANRALGFRDDERDYRIAAHMLLSLGVKSVRLVTNNPRKIAGLERHGIRVTGRIPVEVPPNEHNREYLATKARKSGHLLELAADPIHEQDEPMTESLTGASTGTTPPRVHAAG
jgi:GTP cyclohydrolase II